MEIRTFVERDREPLRALSARAGVGAPSSSLWGDDDSEADVYLTPYMDLAADTLRGEPVAGDFVDPRWPAHLHINVLPEVRGTRVAAALMDAWQTRLRELHSPGCHLQTLVENVRAVRCFEKAGFVPHGPTPVVPGLRHEGKRVRQQTRVWQPG